MEYATHECADCLGLFPANRMTRVSDRVKVGESVTPQRWEENGVWKSGAQTTAHYQNQSKLICVDCKKKRTRAMIIVLLFAAAIVGAFFFFGAAQSGNSNDPSIGDLNPTEAERSSSDRTSDDPADATSAAGINDQSAPTETSPSPSITAVDDAPRVMPSADKLSGAVSAALETGQSVAWTSGEKSGEVAVSDTVQITGGACRRVTVEGQSATWCRMDGRDWKIAE